MGGPGPRLSDPPARGSGGADPPGPLRDVRLAVRAALRSALGQADGPSSGASSGPSSGLSSRSGPRDGTVLVGVSGGPDSLALLAAAVAVAGPLRVRVGAVCVDHGWHPRTRHVAARVARAALDLGADRVRVVRVVPPRAPGGGWAGGPEEAARTARLTALEQAAGRDGAVAVLLGHTLDDQAEQVLLGLARGSGARSLAGMPARRGVFLRPLLGLRRDVVRAACPDLPGLALPWHDPSNGPAGGGAGEGTLLRARVRGEVLPALVDVVGQAAVASLARSADLLREDADALDAWAAREADALAGSADPDPRTAHPGPVALDVAPLRALPPAVRGRVLRLLATSAGARALSLAHTRALDALVTASGGHGPVALPGPVTASLTTGADGCGRLTLAVDDPPREDPHGRP